MGKKKSGFLKEFKEFAMKGNMLDLAVGVIVGGAFKTVVDALTNSVIMPVVSMFLGASALRSGRSVCRSSSAKSWMKTERSS